MHFATLLISDSGKSRKDIKRIMRPFQEVYVDNEGDDERCTEHYLYDDGEYHEEYWYNPNYKWDWYVVGGRYRGRIHAKTGRKSRFDEHFGMYEWYRKYDRKGCYDYAKVEDIIHEQVEPDNWYYVLTPDGVWHEYEIAQYDSNGSFTHFEPNPEWEDFVGNFIAPYTGCMAVTLDIHR